MGRCKIVHDFRSPEELIPHPDNPKIHTEEQIDHIAESIHRFGFTQPVVINTDNIILVGHGRILAAKKMHLKRVPVIVKETDEVENLALLVSDNHLAQQTGMDELKYQALLRNLDEENYERESLGLKYETAEAELAESESQAEETIKQVVIVFEAADFDNVMRKFDAMREREPELKDNTQVFLRLLEHYEQATT